ncbi:MAG: TetR/AcrR family transcriptional regulator [Spirochaetia bacterium]|nr:TetR/AcrR family transcriptional regulator [Spirochaetia bacterium]
MSENPESKRRILSFAADYASQHGLNDLTFGQLAKATGMSKAGLHGPFGSKTGLQLETVRFAMGIFTEHVIVPARKRPAGIERVQAFCEAWMKYVDDRVFPGGCFFGRVTMEGESLQREVTEEILRAFELFRRFLTGELRKEQSFKGSSATVFADQILGLVISYNWAVSSLYHKEIAASIRSLIREKFAHIPGAT